MPKCNPICYFMPLLCRSFLVACFYLFFPPISFSLLLRALCSDEMLFYVSIRIRIQYARRDQCGDTFFILFIYIFFFFYLFCAFFYCLTMGKQNNFYVHFIFSIVFFFCVGCGSSSSFFIVIKSLIEALYFLKCLRCLFCPTKQKNLLFLIYEQFRLLFCFTEHVFFVVFVHSRLINFHCSY